MSRFTLLPTPAQASVTSLQLTLGMSNLPTYDRTTAIDPVTLMISECMTILAAMRKLTRWTHSGVAAILGAGDIFAEDDSITSNLGLTSSPSQKQKSNSNNDNPLLSSFLQLRSMLTDVDDLYSIDSLTLLQPFLLVIKSSSTSGHITSLGLSAVGKFLAYDIISFKLKNLQSCLVQIISSLTHCRFEAADQNSDDSVLLKVLRLLEIILESPLLSLLPNEVVSEVTQTCLSLACNKKRSEVLRKAAEMAMVSITIRIFSRLKELPHNNEEVSTNFAEKVLPEDTIGGTETPETELEKVEKVPEDAEKPKKVEKHDHSPKDTASPFDIVCITEFLGILISMISPANQYQHMESTRVFALSLINTAIEVSGTEIPSHPLLMTLISDPVCKHLLQIITTTDSPGLLQTALQLFSTIAIVLGSHLKSQIELTFNLLFRSILPSAAPQKDIKGNETAVLTRIATSKEMLVESLSLLWSRSPVFFSNLFIDYDCNFDRTDLSVAFIDFLCELSLPESAVITTDNVPPICLEGILSLISGVNDRIKILSTRKDLSDFAPHKLILSKDQKTAFVKCTEILNENPKLGIKALKERGFIQDETNTNELAKFFFSKSVRLNKKVLGEYLAKPKNAELLQQFIDLFDFTDLRVDEALRILLKAFRLPGESQQIERIVETFAERYVSCQPEDKGEDAVRPDRDAVFVLSYSIILLNTDLHNPQVKKQMDLEAYKRNLRGVYNGKDFPEWYLAKIYQSIRDREIIMPEEHHGTDKWFDDAWHNLVSSQAEVESKEGPLGIVQLCQFDKLLFETVVDKLIDTLIKVFKEASDDHIITRLMSSIDKCANICLYYGLSSSIDRLVSLLIDLTSLADKSYTQLNVEENRDEIPITQIKIENKEDAITVSEMAVWFGRDFKAQLSTVVLFRLIRKSDCKVTDSWEKFIRIILTLFENCLVNPNLFSEFQRKVKLNPLPKVKPRYIINRAKVMKDSGILSTFSSFLKGYSDEPPEPSDQEVESTLSTIDCVKSINVAGIFESISKGPSQDLSLFVEFLLRCLPEFNETTKRYYETEVLFIFEVAVCFCLLLKDVSVTKNVVEKLAAYQKSEVLSKKSMLRLNSYYFMTSRDADNDVEDVLDSLLGQDKEILIKQGVQLVQSLISLVDDDSTQCKKLLNSEKYWKVMRLFGSGQAHADVILRFVENLVKNSPGEINSNNFMSILGLLDEISSLGAIGSQWEQENERLASTGQKKEERNNEYFKKVVDLSRDSIRLTSELSHVVPTSETKEKDLTYSLVQALAHQCFNPCREVRAIALKTLQQSILASTLEGEFTSYGIFKFGLFPLLAELKKPEVIQTDPTGFPATQTEVLSLVSRVFLHYQSKFTSEETEEVWLEILDNFKDFPGKEKAQESEVELLKNMLLVLQTEGILAEEKPIWNLTWDKIDKVYPTLKNDVTKENTDGKASEKENEKEKVVEKDDKVVDGEDAEHASLEVE